MSCVIISSPPAYGWAMGYKQWAIIAMRNGLLVIAIGRLLLASIELTQPTERAKDI